MTILYEDNHLLIVSKAAGDIVQGDKTGDRTLADMAKDYLREKYHKPGQVFLGVTHRLDRPVSGCVILARTSKALSRMNDMFRRGEVSKTYHAIVLPPPPGHTSWQSGADVPDDEGRQRLTAWLTRNEKQNKSYAHSRQVAGAKQAVLDYRTLAHGDRYDLVEVRLHTGRHHQIRCQLAADGRPIKGDLKYGAPRSNPDGSISLHARTVRFIHPVSHEPICVTAPYPADPLWQRLSDLATPQQSDDTSAL